MRKNLIRLTTLLVLSIVLIGLVGCNKDKYKYPSKIPTISSPTSTYLTIGTEKITNERLYRRILANYGLDRFHDWLDGEILKNITYTENELTAFTNRKIYGVEDLEEYKGDLEETKTEYINSMIIAGYDTKESQDAYFELELRRYLFAKSKLLAEIDARDAENPFFSDSTLESNYKNNYKPTVTTIIITFNSEFEARALLSKYGVDTSKLSLLWYDKTTGKVLTDDEVKQVFINMYNDVYSYYTNNEEILKEGVAYTKEADEITFDLNNELHEKSTFNYTYSDLSSISATIANRVFNNLTLSSGFHKSYTTAPLLYLSNYYMALKISETEAESFDDVKDKIIADLIEQNLSTSFINNQLYLERHKANIEIFDEALESLFVQDYNDFFTNQNIIEYPKYEKTTSEHDRHVAHIKVNSNTVELKADDFFTILKDMHGISTSIGYMNQYLLLSNDQYNKIYNPYTDSKIDQDKYNSIYKSEVQIYKDELEKGTFASIGMPSNYGWDNFLRDYLGILSIPDLLSNGDIYTKSLDLFAKSLYTYENDDDDYSIKAQMQKIYDEFFSVSSFTLSAYLDYDLNTVADDMEDWTEIQKIEAAELLSLIIERAKDITKDTLHERLTEEINRFKASPLDDPVYGIYKNQGFHLALSAKSTYTNSTTTNENYKTNLKLMWDNIKAADLIGKTLDTDKNPAYMSTSFDSPTGLTMAFVINTTDTIYISKSSNKIYPDEALIEKYLVTLKSDDEKTNEELKITLTTAEKNSINTYYLPAIKVLEGAAKLDKELEKIRTTMMEEDSIKFASQTEASKYLNYLEAVRALED